MSPLISAIVAGNTVMLKPSELSAATAAVISKMIVKLFNTSEVACFEGDAELSKSLLTLPFDHIFFTGSTTVGKHVVEAGAKNLTSVTLELGGKSPAIIDESADLKKAAQKIAWGKLVNAGQTCIAPDYVLIHANQTAQFVMFYKEAVETMFFKDRKINLSIYGKIINEKQFNRLEKLVRDSVNAGAVLTSTGVNNKESLTFLPTLLTQVDLGHAVMHEEIFGPVLPIIGFTKIEEAIEIVNKNNKPLALYLFSEDSVTTEKVILETSSGGACVNDVLVHISNPNLPFGGVNSSGMGSCHGVFGFKNFSHERAVVVHSKFGITKMLYRPYDNKAALLKWLKKLM